MKNWSAQKKNIQIIVSSAFILLIAGGIWGLVDHQRSFVHQLIDDRLDAFNTAYWEAISAEADKLETIARKHSKGLTPLSPSKVPKQLDERFNRLSAEHDVHHLALYEPDEGLLGMQDKDGLVFDRHKLQLLNVPNFNEGWHIEIGQEGEVLLCVVEEIQKHGEIEAYFELARPAESLAIDLAKDHRILSLLAISHKRPHKSEISVNNSVSSLNEPDFHIVASAFENLPDTIENERVTVLGDITRVEFQYHGRYYQGNLRRAFDTNEQLAVVRLAAIDISDLVAQHNRKLALYLALSIVSFILLILVVLRYLRAVEVSLIDTYQSFAQEVEDHKQTEAELREIKSSLEDGIEERTEELSRLNCKLKDDLKTRHSIQQALATSERQYRTLFDHSYDAMILLEGDHPTLCNTAAVTLLQLENHAQIQDIDLHQLLAESSSNSSKIRIQFMRALKSSRFGTPLHREWRCRGIQGKEFYAEITLSKIPSEDERELAHLTIRDITEKKEAELKISSQAYYDSLTSLPNRNLFMDRLNQAVSFADRNGCFGAVLFMDLDNFKYINDSLGHAVGDAILIEVGKRLQATARSQDTVARFGGDEFVMLVPASFANERMATLNTQKIAQKIRATFAPPFVHNGNEFHLTPSIGVTLFNDSLTPVEDILKHADTAMYQAKNSGKNSICFFESEMQRTIDYRLHLESKMRDSIKRSSFDLHFQPKVDNSGQVTGAESLCRWRLADGSWISPAEFIPIAEETGLIADLGAWVIEASVAALARIHERFSNDFTMAINVSPLQINQSNIVRQFLHTCTYYQVKPTQITIEITENVLMQDAQSTEEKLRRLKSHGFQISIDDFGTGYSSLAYLKHLSINELKIDRSFIADIGQDPDDDAIVETILAMSKHLNLDVVAEGVENLEQLKFLRSHDCRSYQGFYFSKPLAEDDLFDFIERSNESEEFHH